MIESLSQRATAPRLSTGRRAPRVLIGEDDAEMRRLLARLLARDGYEILEAADGAQLIERLTSSLRETAPVDLVITDLRMPSLGGFEAVEWFRALGCRAPVIVITAFGDHRTSMEAARLGIVRVMDKPFDFDELRELIHDLFKPPRQGRGWS